ncbi:MAG: hypothetical protein DRP68_00895 [Candidatus Omnitrophota bacterium]|nr:MAG: hypothetical protein DRP68_00895 [Candidatus Omnitrophota bacterium]RKY46388.1 MAG: hypothetical protein DRP81_00745 [Candidatus Omnitrophota bacterium]HDN85967.1 bifunctional riboflavin kinase/FAD synthetase [Candidatus Omnitrophota bacterium]
MITFRFPLLRRIECVATVGVFDGLHLGHLVLIRKLRKLAKRKKLPSLVVTFWPLPQQVLSSSSFLGFLTNLNEKKKILAREKINYLLLFPTTQKLLRLRGKAFLKKLISSIKVNTLVVGEDFRFGHKREIGIKKLKELSTEMGFKVIVLKKKKLGKRVISSSYIRRLIKGAFFSQAERLLGRRYIIEGRVVKGKGLGSIIGYPTLNVDWQDKVIPKRGVYVVKVFLKRRWHLALCNIGFNPTVSKDKKLSMEIYVLALRKKINLKKVRILFLERLRNERKFPSLEKLKERIDKDIRVVLSKYSG